MGTKIIPEKKIKVCDVCEKEIKEKMKRCPLCDKEICYNCETELLTDIFGEKGFMCDNCGMILSPMDKKFQKEFISLFYKPIMDFCKKVILTEKL